MPSRISVVALASVAVLGLAGCEKQSPYVSVTAGGVVVKARAIQYCRGEDCDDTDDNPTLKLGPEDTLGIDVPRSLAEQGWSATLSNRAGQSEPLFEVGHDHYRTLKLGRLRAGEPFFVTIVRDPTHGRGLWRFTLVAG
jgi:hypothetical protein